MIAADTSSLIAFFEGEAGRDVTLVDEALAEKQLVMPPPVLSELLSEPELPAAVSEALKQIPLIPVQAGFWERAGKSRAKVLKNGFKARVADAFIAQSCLDEGLVLITRDRDFERFAKLCGLKVV